MTQATHFDLRGTIALVTGASRGAGRGIAIELGAAGATVYVTGRTTRSDQPDTYAEVLEASKLDVMPGNIDDTAEEVTRQGGDAIAVRCDHTNPADVASLFERIERCHGRLDLLVNNAWGGHESFDGEFHQPFWKRPLAEWDAMMDRGLRNHWLASRHAAPLMIRQGQGLIVSTTFWDRDRYLTGNLIYDLAKAGINRLALGMAEELRDHGVASVAVSPGWMRTELVLAAHDTDEEHWTKRTELARTESPRYLGRAVVALACDPNVHERTGSVVRVGDLAKHYGFVDVDGRRIPPFEL
jgi:NAD(P)-dependent dehydrogenase (short-subunit alcohol dehydrogenase family)